MGLFNPISIIKKLLNNLWNNEFCQNKNCNAFFFSTSSDWLTVNIVKRLSEENTVIYYNHYDHLTSLVGCNSFSLKRKIKKIIFSYVTKVDFLSQSNINFPKFNYEKYDISKIDVLSKPDVNERFLYTVLGNIKKVLFLISPEEMKPYADFIIPSNIPSEFLNYKSFNFVFGLTSAALSYPAQKELCTVYSLVETLEYKDPLKQKNLKSYISKYSDDKIVFELKKLNYFQ